MNVTVLHRKPDPASRPEYPASSHLGFIDCDVHPFINSPDEFDPFLSARWREHRQSIGGRSRGGLSKTSSYPRMSPGVGMRQDSWGEDGSFPGSDLGVMRRQLLDLPAGAQLIQAAQGCHNMLAYPGALAAALHQLQVLVAAAAPADRLHFRIHVGTTLGAASGPRPGQHAGQAPFHAASLSQHLEIGPRHAPQSTAGQTPQKHQTAKG